MSCNFESIIEYCNLAKIFYLSDDAVMVSKSDDKLVTWCDNMTVSLNEFQQEVGDNSSLMSAPLHV